MARNVTTVIVAAIALVGGAFIASPELRAYAANTVGSADIINNSIQSVDIKDGQVKTADLAGSAVNSAKIADGAVAYADFARSSVVVEHRDDCNCGGTGWDPNGSQNFARVYDDAVNTKSVISVSVEGPFILNCYSTRAVDGYFIVQCTTNIPDGVDLNYAVFNHP